MAENSQCSIVIIFSLIVFSIPDNIRCNRISRAKNFYRDDNNFNFRGSIGDYRDVNNISIPKDKKFDLITSWLSCGFHYPVSTYKDLILQHSHKDTRIFLDIRLHLKTKEIFHNDNSIEILKILNRHRKYIAAEIRFV